MAVATELASRRDQIEAGLGFTTRLLSSKGKNHRGSRGGDAIRVQANRRTGKALEKSLDKSLFQRRGGRVMLTEAGQTLYTYVQKILDLHREARKEIAGQEPKISGELVISASSIPGEHLLPGVLSVFGQKYPNVRVRAAVSDSMAVIAQVERGEVSVGLVGQKVDKSHLEFRHLISDQMVLVVPPGHALARQKKVTAAQLAIYPLILRESGSGLRHCFEKSLERQGHSLAELRVALELGSNEAASVTCSWCATAGDPCPRLQGPAHSSSLAWLSLVGLLPSRARLRFTKPRDYSRRSCDARTANQIQNRPNAPTGSTPQNPRREPLLNTQEQDITTD